MSIRRERWGVMPDGRPVELFTLTGDNGFEVSIASYGGIVTRLLAPDKSGSFSDVVLGYDTLNEYLDDQCFLGCIIGRVANRISNAQFTLDGVNFALDRNHGNHQLHGGAGGFHTRVWQAEATETDRGPQVRLSHLSPDGAQGFPGTLGVTVTYTLLDDGLETALHAASDAPTPVTLTNHTYFNLAGHDAGNCLSHEISIPAGRFLVTDQEQIPTGDVAPVAGTPLDFATPAAIGSRIDEDFEPLAIGQGYDHFFVLDEQSPMAKHAATVYDPASGRTLDLYTDQPGLQFYSGNHMPDSLPGKNGATYGFRSGFCLEPQGFPDAPNRPEFPPITVEPGKDFDMIMAYHFSTK